MSPTKPADCTDMTAVRSEIDRIDDQLVDLLVERWGYVDRAWQLKHSVEEATVPWRIREVIDRVRARAQAADVPPALMEALWRQLIGWGIQFEEEKLRERTS